MKKVICLIIVVLLIVFYAKEGYGQSTKKINYTFSLDTAKAQTLPFDIPFTVKLPFDKTDPILHTYLVKLNPKGNFVTDKKTSFPDETTLLPLRLKSLGEEGENQFLYIDIPALKPDKRYMLLAVTAKEQVVIKKKLIELYCINPPNPSRIIDLVYKPEPFYFTEGDRSFYVAAQSIISKLDEANRDCKICELIKGGPKPLKVEPFKGEKINVKLPPYLTPTCDTCYAGSRKELAFITGTSSLLEIWRDQIFDGTYKLDTLGNKSRPVVATAEQAKTEAQKISNVKSSIAIISDLRKSLLYVKSLYPISSFSPITINGTQTDLYGEIVQSIDEYLKKLKSNAEVFQKNVDASNTYNSKLDACISQINLDVGWQFNTLRGGTSTYQFYTRNAYFIKPDFGVIYYGDKLFNNSSFSGAAPFVGFHINFKATNDNVPFWTNLDVWRFPTLQIGVPVFAQNLSQDGSRKHLVADKFSIFTGAGINLAHTARIHYGALWFQALQSVQGNESRYKVKSVPYMGFSIDLRLRTLFPGIKEAIFGVPGVPSY